MIIQEKEQNGLVLMEVKITTIKNLRNIHNLSNNGSDHFP